jgi:hypothetical protein
MSAPPLPWVNSVDFVVFWWYGYEDDGFWVVRGRMRACVPYCISYILSYFTKHSPMIGRVLGGTSTSLLFSAFESCIVAEHNKVPAHIPLHRDADTSEVTCFNFNPNQLIIFPMKTATVIYILLLVLCTSIASTLPETTPLPSARLFAECILSGTWQTWSLPSARKKTLGEEWALGKGPLCRVPKLKHSAKSFFCRVSR